MNFVLGDAIDDQLDAKQEEAGSDHDNGGGYEDSDPVAQAAAQRNGRLVGVGSWCPGGNRAMRTRFSCRTAIRSMNCFSASDAFGALRGRHAWCGLNWRAYVIINNAKGE